LLLLATAQLSTTHGGMPPGRTETLAPTSATYRSIYFCQYAQLTDTGPVASMRGSLLLMLRLWLRQL